MDSPYPEARLSLGHTPISTGGSYWVLTLPPFRLFQHGSSVFLTPTTPELKISPLWRPHKATETPQRIFISAHLRRILAASPHLPSSFRRVSKSSPSS